VLGGFGPLTGGRMVAMFIWNEVGHVGFE
jgi:hypothetical protein